VNTESPSWVADGPNLSSLIKVLLFNNEFPFYALTNTMIGGDIWVATFNGEKRNYNNFNRVLKGFIRGARLGV
jgi:hypothetical protein